MPEENEIDASPNKEFFIEMITRDISVTAGILDLIDNPIDKAVEVFDINVMDYLNNTELSRQFSETRISINFDCDSFLMKDNCGGMSISEAKERVFRFGNCDLRNAKAGLSVFGIGMKRAFFKIGQKIKIESSTEDEWFVIDINVPEWMGKQDGDWTFEFSKTGTQGEGSIHAPKTTRIKITDLLASCRNIFSKKSFENELISRISNTYSLFIEAGLKIEVNGKSIDSGFPTLGTYDDLTPGRAEILEGDISILIISGISSKDDKRPHGWYIFCNGRMILEADKSKDTGWGENLPQFHNKYNHFIGYVYFKSDDLGKLPWDTTKSGIVFESEFYQKALDEMQIQGRPVLDFLNKLYVDNQDMDSPQQLLLKSTHDTDIREIKKVQAFRADISKYKARERETTISFNKPNKEINMAKEALGDKNLSASKVGKLTFEYFLKMECE